MIDPVRWWRSHNVRLRLTLWYVGGHGRVLGGLRRRRLRVRQPQRVGLARRAAPRRFLLGGRHRGREPRRADHVDAAGGPAARRRCRGCRCAAPTGASCSFSNAEARRRPIAGEPGPCGRRDEDRIVSSCDVGGDADARAQPPRATIERAPASIVQVGRSEEPMREQLRELVLMLVLGLPLAVAVAGLGGYVAGAPRAGADRAA